MPVEVSLGGVTVPVIPQKHAYISHRLGPAIQSAVEGGEGLTGDRIGDWLGAGAYEALSALVPTLPAAIPLHVFQGYPTVEAYEAGDFDEAVSEHLAGCPTIPEIDEAFAVAMRVNGIDKLVELGKAIAGPSGLALLRAQAMASIADSISSPTSPSTTGESDSTSSGTTVPTSTESEDSPSPASPA